MKDHGSIKEFIAQIRRAPIIEAYHHPQYSEHTRLTRLCRANAMRPTRKQSGPPLYLAWAAQLRKSDEWCGLTIECETYYLQWR